VRKLGEQRAIQQAALDAHITTIRTSIVPTLEIADPQSVGVAVVPASERNVVPLPKKRKSAFRRHLAAVLHEALDQLAGEDDVAATPAYAQTAQQFGPEMPVLQTGCATCRGHCCRLGGPRNAFLEAATLRRLMALQPDLRQRQVVGEYLKHMPSESVEDSCVFHGAAGCTLPRTMRADICNDYHCDGLQRLESLHGRSPAQRILIVASSEKDAVRWRLFQANE
jgi:hypothetical protein